MDILDEIWGEVSANRPLPVEESSRALPAKDAAEVENSAPSAFIPALKTPPKNLHLASVTPISWPSGAARGIQKVHYTHDAMIDLIIANPAVSQNALAAHFGYTPSWISQVISSDAFQARLAERSAALVDPIIRSTVEDQFRGMVARSLDILRAKLDREPSAIPDNLALRTLELSSRALGYGARDPAPSTPVNIEVHLENLGGGLVSLLQRKKALALEGEATEVKTS